MSGRELPDARVTARPGEGRPPSWQTATVFGRSSGHADGRGAQERAVAQSACLTVNDGAVLWGARQVSGADRSPPMVQVTYPQDSVIFRRSSSADPQ